MVDPNLAGKGKDIARDLPKEVIERIAESTDEGARWPGDLVDLDVNLVAWSPSHGVPTHVNPTVDVLLIGIRGTGILEIDGRSIPVNTGGVHLIPRGARRAIRAQTRLLYLTCHRRQPREFSSEELLGRATPDSE
jgi:mannose-6-phosphate isomerase-like protein (cupin superfamily)